ncbi:hypothetical protein [Flavobacterium sp. ZE23DGlu08]|uniref:hypothetical protein n=1 Tax=Flavobacterium sp. ZE23DGlu08 TaxID=3059026 RepID=UPI0026603BC8|nr:hypothetical protein [Flavobacterium sp. ZE23DGlu08]WKL44532.1 hypothetical protein Q1W72_02645 [Flavobacterium sp. ZE23DGlu08]
MIKNNQISQGEGEILDLKLNSILSIACNNGFSIISIGTPVWRLKLLHRIKKSIGIIISGMESDKGENSLVLIQEPTLAKFNIMRYNTIEAVLAYFISLSKELLIKRIVLFEYFIELNAVSETLNKSKRDINKIVVLPFRFHCNRKIEYKKRDTEFVSLAFSLNPRNFSFINDIVLHK